MLNPNSRSLYTSALTPPPGMIFDEAVATTFSYVASGQATSFPL
jgi:hypothetical protein